MIIIVYLTIDSWMNVFKKNNFLWQIFYDEIIVSFVLVKTFDFVNHFRHTLILSFKFIFNFTFIFWFIKQKWNYLFIWFIFHKQNFFSCSTINYTIYLSKHDKCRVFFQIQSKKKWTINHCWKIKWLKINQWWTAKQGNILQITIQKKFSFFFYIISIKISCHHDDINPYVCLCET